MDLSRDTKCFLKSWFFSVPPPSAYEQIDNQFGFLNNLFEMDAGVIKKDTDKLVKIYKNDLESYLGNESIQFKEFCKLYIGEKKRI